MDGEKLNVPKAALVCAARHFAAAHESAAMRTAVEFGAVCMGCSYAEHCRGDWLETAAPVFEAAQIFPNLLREDQS